MLTKDLAICIRAVDYSETSQIVTFFTRETGKIGAIAKGSKRPKSAFGGPIEILSHGNIVFSDSSRERLATLTEFELEYTGAAQAGTHKDLFALNCCYFAAELLSRFTDDYDPHPQLFDSFLRFLDDVQQDNAKPRNLALLILLQLGLLKEIGLQPVLDYCANCKTQHAARNSHQETYFSSSANGLICRDCEPAFTDKIKLSRNAAACLTNLKQIPEASEDTLREIEKIFVRHFSELLGGPLRMAKHILVNP